MAGNARLQRDGADGQSLVGSCPGGKKFPAAQLAAWRDCLARPQGRFRVGVFCEGVRGDGREGRHAYAGELGSSPYQGSAQQGTQAAPWSVAHAFTVCVLRRQANRFRSLSPRSTKRPSAATCQAAQLFRSMDLDLTTPPCLLFAYNSNAQQPQAQPARAMGLLAVGAALWTEIMYYILKYCRCVYLDYTYYINILEDAYGC